MNTEILKRPLQDELAQLLKKSGAGRVFSLFLQADLSAPMAVKYQFHEQTRRLIRETSAHLSDEEKKKFKLDALMAWTFLVDAKPVLPSLALFCRFKDGLIWWRGFRGSIGAQARWCSMPYLRLLIEHQDEIEPAALVLADRAHARLLALHPVIAELGRTQAPLSVHRLRRPPRDMARGQRVTLAPADRNADEQLKTMAHNVERLAATAPVGPLLVAGPTWATHELERFLSPEIRRRVEKIFHVSPYAAPSELARRADELSSQARAERDRALVSEVVLRSRKHEAAVIGSRATVEAVQAGKAALFVFTKDAGPADGRLEQLIEVTLARGGRVKFVAGSAGQPLARFGGMAALLKLELFKKHGSCAHAKRITRRK